MFSFFKKIKCNHICWLHELERGYAYGDPEKRGSEDYDWITGVCVRCGKKLKAIYGLELGCSWLHDFEFEDNTSFIVTDETAEELIRSEPMSFESKGHLASKIKRFIFKSNKKLDSLRSILYL